MKIKSLVLVLASLSSGCMTVRSERPSASLRFENPAVLPQPHGYSNLAVVSGDADLVFLSGQTGEDASGYLPSGVAEQYVNAVANVEALLASQGLSVRDIVKLTSYFVAGTDLDPLTGATTSIDTVAPTATLVRVSGLADPEALVELEVIAVRSASKGEEPRHQERLGIEPDLDGALLYRPGRFQEGMSPDASQEKGRGHRHSRAGGLESAY